jgi:tetratricopeptide (TPR) repeat protein
MVRNRVGTNSNGAMMGQSVIRFAEADCPNRQAAESDLNLFEQKRSNTLPTTSTVATSGTLRVCSAVLILVLLSFSATVSLAGEASLDRDISLMQRILKHQPNPEIYYRLGDLYVQKGRQTGDITYFNLAGNSLREAIKLLPSLEQAHRHLAFVLYSLHDFAGAASEARQSIQLDANDSYAYGVLGDSELETGAYAEANQTYARMIALKGDLYSYSRRSGLETIRGDNRLAIADQERAIASGQQIDEPAEGIAWAQTTLAQDYFLMGKLDDADEQGQAALKTYPGYHLALATLGRVRAAQGRLVEAADYYRRAIAVIPLPEYAVALADVYTKMGRQRDAALQRQLVEFIARLNVLNRILYNRVLVDYYADHDINHKQAVELAAGEYAIRKDIYGDDALAWALYRDGQAAKALPHIVAALRFRTADARLYFHAGMIYKAVGQTNQARSNLKQALAINSHFQPLLDEVAASEYAALNKAHTKQYAEGNADARR